MSSEEALKLFDAANEAGKLKIFNLLVDEVNRAEVEKKLEDRKKQ